MFTLLLLFKPQMAREGRKLPLDFMIHFTVLVKKIRYLGRDYPFMLQSSSWV